MNATVRRWRSNGSVVCDSSGGVWSQHARGRALLAPARPDGDGARARADRELRRRDGRATGGVARDAQAALTLGARLPRRAVLGCLPGMMRDRRGGQLDLFVGAAAPPATGRGVAAVRVPEPLLAIAARVPASVRLGTSSWSFPGWAGRLRRRDDHRAPCARWSCRLCPPSPPARGGDRPHVLCATHRRSLRRLRPGGTRRIPLPGEGARGVYDGAIPAARALRGAGGSAQSAIPRRGVRRRAGGRAGGRRPRGGARTDPLQLPPQDAAALLGGAAGFAQRVHAFLRALPRGPLYAVELRTPRVFGPRYLAALADAGAVHCLSAHPSMPDLDTQAGLLGSAAPPATVVRWMLPRHLDYESADGATPRSTDSWTRSRRARCDRAPVRGRGGRGAARLRDRQQQGRGIGTAVDLPSRGAHRSVGGLTA